MSEGQQLESATALGRGGDQGQRGSLIDALGGVAPSIGADSDGGGGGEGDEGVDREQDGGRGGRARRKVRNMRE